MKSDRTGAQTQTLLELHQMLYHWAIRSSRVSQCDRIPHSVIPVLSLSLSSSFQVLQGLRVSHKMLPLFWTYHRRRALWPHPRKGQVYRAWHRHCRLKSLSHPWPPFCSSFHRAKLFHSPNEQFTSLVGYTAPEVIRNNGHGKLVDVWCTGMIPHAWTNDTSSLCTAEQSGIVPWLASGPPSVWLLFCCYCELLEHAK